MIKTSRSLSIAAIFSAILIACGDKDDSYIPPTGPGGNGNGEPVVVTYAQLYTEIFGPICTNCHDSKKSGAQRNGAPITVNWDTYEAAVASAMRGNARVQAGTMPPTGPLSVEQKRLFQGWIDSGTPK